VSLSRPRGVAVFSKERQGRGVGRNGIYKVDRVVIGRDVGRICWVWRMELLARCFCVCVSRTNLGSLKSLLGFQFMWRCTYHGIRVCYG